MAMVAWRDCRPMKTSLCGQHFEETVSNTGRTAGQTIEVFFIDLGVSTIDAKIIFRFIRAPVSSVTERNLSTCAMWRESGQ